MSSAQRFFRGLSAFILALCLFAMAGSFAVSTTLLNASYLKSTLASNGTYNNIVNSVFDVAISQLNKNGGQDKGDSNINTQTVGELKPVVESALTPQFLQNTTEAIIDGTFAWLNGDASEPNFAIQTTDVKIALQNSLTTYLQNKVAALPNCTTKQSGDSDPFSATCWIPSAEGNAQIASSVGDFINQIPIFENPELSLQSLNAEQNFASDKPVQNVPTGYRLLKWLPAVFGVIALICLAVVILLSKPKLRMLKTLGFAFVWPGSFLLVGGIIGVLAASKIDPSAWVSSGEQANFVDVIVVPIAKTIIKSLSNYHLYFGSAYIVIAIGLFIAAYITRQKQPVTKTPTPKK